MSHVWGFFYGGLINPAVMQRLGLAPTRREVATLAGYRLTIAPWVNLEPQADGLVFGLLLEVTHAEIARVYAQLKAAYLPYPVLAHGADGAARPALCYIVPDMTPAPAERDHVRNLLDPATELGFPAWYLAHIASFLPD